MQHICEYISANREWIFSGVGVFAIGIVIRILLALFRRKPSEERRHNKHEQSRACASPQPPTTEPPQQSETEAKPHIVEYVVNTIVPRLTEDEIDILRRFVHFPRSQYTQGYRLDWIYDELLADKPKGIVHMIIESLLAKGFLERWTTLQGSSYYKLGEDAIPVLVDNGFLKKAELRVSSAEQGTLDDATDTNTNA